MIRSAWTLKLWFVLVTGYITIQHFRFATQLFLLSQCTSTVHRGGFRHVRPNRGPPKKGIVGDCRTPARHFLTCGVGPIYAVLRHLKHVSTKCFRTLMPYIFTEQGPIGFKSGPDRAHG